MLIFPTLACDALGVEAEKAHAVRAKPQLDDCSRKVGHGRKRERERGRRAERAKGQERTASTLAKIANVEELQAATV